MLVDINDLSEDEDSPSHELSHQGRLSAIHGAQRAFDFGSNLMRALQVRTYPRRAAFMWIRLRDSLQKVSIPWMIERVLKSWRMQNNEGNATSIAS